MFCNQGKHIKLIRNHPEREQDIIILKNTFVGPKLRLIDTFFLSLVMDEFCLGDIYKTCTTYYNWGKLKSTTQKDLFTHGLGGMSHFLFLSSGLISWTGAAGILNHHSLTHLSHLSLLSFLRGNSLVKASRKKNRVKYLIGTMANAKAMKSNKKAILPVACGSAANRRALTFNKVMFALWIRASTCEMVSCNVTNCSTAFRLGGAVISNSLSALPLLACLRQSIWIARSTKVQGKIYLIHPLNIV